MRPIRLELEGFTSFRQRCELNFSEVDLFAITGPTGAGKSSLLDAMTYALFGRTARLGKAGAARELVSQGATSMFVSLEFHAGSQIYKVYRGLKGSTPKGQLAKQSADGEWISETGSIKQIDVAIESIVGLDFEGFTRAVILPQGRFDEFLRGDARQRRDVLKDLLGLQVFERMMQSANNKAQGFGADAKALESQVDADVTDETRKELEDSISAMQAQEANQQRLIAKLEHAQSIAQELSEHRIKLQTHRQDLEAAEQECVKLQDKVEQLGILFQEKRKALNDVENSISALAYDPGEHLRLSRLIPRVKRRAELKGEITKLERKHGQHAGALQSDSAKLETVDAALAEAAKASKTDDERLEAAKEKRDNFLSRFGSPQQIRSLGPGIKSLAEKEGEVSAVQSEIKELQTRLSGKEKVLGELAVAKEQAELTRIAAEQQLEHLQQKHRAVDLRHELRPGEPCPVCEQTVTTLPHIVAVADLEEAKRALKQARERFEQANKDFLTAPGSFTGIEKEVAHKSERLKDLTDSISAVREQVRNMLDAELGPDSLKQLEELAALIEHSQKEVARLEKESKASAKVESDCRTQVESLKVQCANHRERLEEAAQQIQQKQKEYADFEQELAGLAELAVLEQGFSALEQAKKQKDSLERQREEAASALAQVQHDLADTSGRLDTERKRAAQTKNNLEQVSEKAQTVAVTLQDAIAPLELPGGRELERLREELNAANNLLRKVESERNVNQARLAAVSDKLKKNQELREQCKQLKHSAAVFGDLGTLLNATHFQDYMLQSSYKLLAREGSRYFEELTGGRYSFHSQEDEFSVRDHSNGDELRSVSTLSGGESFLASLSLALALAQSIVELSGERGKVALESLFLDEGFSTLDPETLGKVADALPALQKKGRLIGVITHVESLAEQLPERVEIVKTPTGSRILKSGVVLETTATTA
jgi:DNA repair protein SbcC/Rad50